MYSEQLSYILQATSYILQARSYGLQMICQILQNIRWWLVRIVSNRWFLQAFYFQIKMRGTIYSIQSSYDLETIHMVQRLYDLAQRLDGHTYSLYPRSYSLQARSYGLETMSYGLQTTFFATLPPTGKVAEKVVSRPYESMQRKKISYGN